MAIQLGGAGYAEPVFQLAYLGSTEVDKVYLGAVQVYVRTQ